MCSKWADLKLPNMFLDGWVEKWMDVKTFIGLPMAIKIQISWHLQCVV
jgi:hypothetical protein